MGSLADRLRGKQRRRITVAIQVAETAAEEAAAEDARVLWMAAAVDTEDDTPALAAKARFDEAVAALEEAREASVLHVEFAQLAADDFEAAVQAHTLPDGDTDRAGLLVTLAAACAVDESLRDEGLWRDVLSTFSAGERDDLYRRLFAELNYSLPARGLGKG